MIGVLAGFLGSLLGVGGGSVITPVLVALGYDIKQVIPASLLSIVGTSLGGLDIYHREGLVDYRTGIRLEATTVLGSLIGVHTALLLEPRMLKAALSLVLIYIAASMLRKIRQANEEEHGSEMSYTRRQLLGNVAAVFKGFMSALVGIGGGILGVPILHRIMGLDMKRSIATSKFLVGVTAAAGVLGYIMKGALDPCLGISLSLGTIVGGIVGSMVGVRLSNKTSSIVFALFLLVMSIVIILRG